MPQPIREYFVLCFPDQDSALSWRGAILRGMTPERVRRYVGGEPRAVLFTHGGPTGDPNCAEYMYASAGTVLLAHELGLRAQVLGKIPAAGLPEGVVMLIGDEQNRPRR